MTRRKTIIYISIATLLIILGTLYASFPWLVTSVIRSQLAAHGMRDVQVQVDYPALSQVKLQTLSFNGPVAESEVKVEIPTITITYQVWGLLVGQLQSVQIPAVNIHMQLPDTTQRKSAAQPMTALPIGLLSTKWLADIPVKVLELDHLQLYAGTTRDTVYHLQLNAGIHNRQLDLAGKLSLPWEATPISFSANAHENGQAHAHLVSNVKGEPPLLTLEVSPQAAAPTQVLNGQLHTQFDRLLPVMEPVLSSIYPSLHSAAGLHGELNSQWQARMVNEQWQLNGTINIAALSGQWDKLTIPRSEWQGTWQLIASQFELQSSLKSFQQKVRVNIDLQHDSNTGQGQSSLKLIPVEFNNDTMRLANMLKDWDLPVDLTQGRVSATGTISWKKQLRGQGQLLLNNVGGHHKDITFEGVQGKMELSYDDGIQTRQPVPMTVKYVNVGFPINNVSMTFAISPKAKQLLPVINVSQFEAFLLGGRAHGGPFDYDFYREKNTFIVKVEGLAVHDLMELERQEGLSGDGVLDGSVPIEITNGKIAISEGALSARKPGGAIKYTPTDKVAALAKSNASVNLMVKALSNFKYDVLDIKTDYLAEGDLHLKVRLQGHNPDWQKGQPINLNLNLEENIPTLLRSLQLSSEISEKVKKQVQEKPGKAR